MYKIVAHSQINAVALFDQLFKPLDFDSSKYKISAEKLLELQNFRDQMKQKMASYFGIQNLCSFYDTDPFFRHLLSKISSSHWNNASISEESIEGEGYPLNSLKYENKIVRYYADKLGLKETATGCLTHRPEDSIYMALKIANSYFSNKNPQQKPLLIYSKNSNSWIRKHANAFKIENKSCSIDEKTGAINLGNFENIVKNNPDSSFIIVANTLTKKGGCDDLPGMLKILNKYKIPRERIFIHLEDAYRNIYLLNQNLGFETSDYDTVNSSLASFGGHRPNSIFLARRDLMEMTKGMKIEYIESHSFHYSCSRDGSSAFLYWALIKKIEEDLIHLQRYAKDLKDFFVKQLEEAKIDFQEIANSPFVSITLNSKQKISQEFCKRYNLKKKDNKVFIAINTDKNPEDIITFFNNLYFEIYKQPQNKKIVIPTQLNMNKLQLENHKIPDEEKKELVEYIEKKLHSISFGYPVMTDCSINFDKPTLELLDELKTFYIDQKSIPQAFLADISNFYKKRFNLKDGLVTIYDGSTDGLKVGLQMGRARFPQAKVFFSDQTHYSLKQKCLDLKIEFNELPSNSAGELDIEKFKAAIKKTGNEPLIINVNALTTMKGGRDDIKAIIKAIKEIKGQSFKDYHIHLDGALGANIANFHDGQTSYDFNDIDTCNISTHKPGTTLPGCVFMCKNNIIPSDFHLKSKANGHIILELWAIIQKFGVAGYKERMKHVFDCRDYLIKKLNKELNLKINQDYRYNDYSNIIFLKAKNTKKFDDFQKRYNLARDNGLAHIIIMPNHKIEYIDALISDLKKVYV